MPDREQGSPFPSNPLLKLGPDEKYHRRVVAGVLESYNSNYDVLAELVQNAVDAVEDAHFQNLSPPFEVDVTVNLDENWLAVLDSGVGMTEEQVVTAFGPSVSFKSDDLLIASRGTNKYRGYKGVGLTFLAYGTDDIVLHTRRENGSLIKARMQNGLGWARGEQPGYPIMKEDTANSPLHAYDRGSYLRIQLSPKTRPRSLNAIASNPKVWPVILRTRSAIGQVLLRNPSPVDITIRLTVIKDAEHNTEEVEPGFLYPHLVEREPEFRFQDVAAYWEEHGEGDVPIDHRRKDGIYIRWDSDKIRDALTGPQREEFERTLNLHKPHLYAFLPYQASVWSDINEAATERTDRSYLATGLVISVDRQRMADRFSIPASRYETLSRNLFVLVDFKDVKPDQGRKTVQTDVLRLAETAADRALQYLARQRNFLKQPGESPSPNQRAIERNHDDWQHNVRTHATNSPIDMPPISYRSTPLTEQDVVGLFNQFAALGCMPGILIFATSQNQTYDCLTSFEASADAPGLKYRSEAENALGLSPYMIGDGEVFSTRTLTLEFKNNLDALVEDVAGDSPKDLSAIDICVCWSKVGERFDGFTLEEISMPNVDKRQYPGVTHVLRRDEDGHSIQVIMLEDMLRAAGDGRIPVLARESAT